MRSHRLLTMAPAILVILLAGCGSGGGGGGPSSTTIQGALTTSDPLDFDGTRIEGFAAMATESGMGTVTMSSTSVDPYLIAFNANSDGSLSSYITESQITPAPARLRIPPSTRWLGQPNRARTGRFIAPTAPKGGSTPTTATPGNTTSITFPVTAGQEYAIIANTVTPLVIGAFTLSFSPEFSGSIQDLSLSTTPPTILQDSLQPNDLEFTDGTHFRDYVCTIALSGTSVVTMTSQILPSYLELHAVNSDGTVGTANVADQTFYVTPTTTQIQVAATQGTKYVVRAGVRSGGPQTVGPFVLIFSPGFNSSVQFITPGGSSRQIAKAQRA